MSSSGGQMGCRRNMRVPGTGQTGLLEALMEAATGGSAVPAPIWENTGCLWVDGKVITAAVTC